MRKHTLKIKSDIKEIHEVEKFVEDICDYYNINNSYFGNILVAVSEAVENSIVHGNKQDPSKSISICFEANQKGIVFSIEDEGEGFNFDNIPDPTDFQNNPEKKGTGIFLIKTLTDETLFLNNGRKVQLQFNITSINREVFSRRMKHVDEYFNVKKDVFEKNS
ncbi:MAG: ATP-binding protein [Bacteroidota bacterium]